MKVLAFVLLCFASQVSAETLLVADHDGNVDDVFGYILLASGEDPVTAIVCTNSDCMGYLTINVTIPRINWFANLTKIPFGMSKARGENSFPWFYRSFSASMGKVPVLANMTSPLKAQPNGDILYESTLRNALKNGQRVTIIATGPMTALANLLRAHPELEAAIEKLIWAAGALNGIAGNIDPQIVYDFVSGSKAEWNVFWDPDAVDFIFRKTRFPIVLLPLNVTNKTAVTPAFMQALQSQSQAGYPMSTLGFQVFSIVSGIKAADTTSFKLWDMTAAMYYLKPEFFTAPQDFTLSVVVDGAQQGTLYNDPNGRAVQAVLDFNGSAGLESFYSYFLKTLRR